MTLPSPPPKAGPRHLGWKPLWRPGSARSVLVSLLVGMLLVVGVTGGSMLFFSNLVVQRQVSRLPPDLREQFREHGDPGAANSSGVESGGGTVDSSGPSDPAASPMAPGPGNAPGSRPPPSAPLSPSDASLPSSPTVTGPVSPSDQIKRARPSPASRARTFVRDVSESLRGASLVSALFGLLVAVLLARRIARPISAVSEAAMKVAAGDLSARAPLLPGDRETTELARNFNVMAQGLQALERERQGTVASIAHELRTPLTVIQARLDAIEDGIYPLDQEQVGQLSAQTQLLTRLVGDLRTVSMAEAGRLTVQPGQVRPLSLARSVAQDLQSARQGSGVTVEVLGHEGTLRADPDRLRQVLVNLVENAFKHARSRIQLTVQPPDEQAPGKQAPTEQAPLAFWMHVDDDGPGIPEEDRERVFENFVRLEPSRARNSGGTGLGLAVVRALMLAHGGEVRLSPSPLGGTRATLRFPVSGQSSAD